VVRIAVGNSARIPTSYWMWQPACKVTPHTAHFFQFLLHCFVVPCPLRNTEHVSSSTVDTIEVCRISGFAGVWPNKFGHIGEVSHFIREALDSDVARKTILIELLRCLSPSSRMPGIVPWNRPRSPTHFKVRPNLASVHNNTWLYVTVVVDIAYSTKPWSIHSFTDSWIKCMLCWNLRQKKMQSSLYNRPEKPRGKARYTFTLSLISALDGGGWSRPRLSRFTPGKKTRNPSYRGLGGPHVGRYGCGNPRPPPGFDPLTVHPVANRESSVNETGHKTTKSTKWYDSSIRCYCRMARPRSADGDGLQIWRVAANILLKLVISGSRQRLVLLLARNVGGGETITSQGKIQYLTKISRSSS